jgi:hypothetical protein
VEGCQRPEPVSYTTAKTPAPSIRDPLARASRGLPPSGTVLEGAPPVRKTGSVRARIRGLWSAREIDHDFDVIWPRLERLAAPASGIRRVINRSSQRSSARANDRTVETRHRIRASDDPHDEIATGETYLVRRLQHAGQRFVTDDESLAARRCGTVTSLDDLAIGPADADRNRFDKCRSVLELGLVDLVHPHGAWLPGERVTLPVPEYFVRAGAGGAGAADGAGGWRAGVGGSVN